MDKFVLITKGAKESNQKGAVRLTLTCYEKILGLREKTGISMCRILEQCVDFALDHLEVVEEDED